MKFDVVVGNPPYQEQTVNTSDSPVYHFFYDLAESVSNKYILISPARFLFDSGKTPKAWNNKMLKSNKIKVVEYWQKSNSVFSNTDVKGGITIVYYDKYSNFEPIVHFTAFDELNSILTKVDSKRTKSINEIIILQNKFNLNQLYSDFPNYKNIIGSSGKERRLTTPIFESLSVFSYDGNFKDDYQIKGLINNKRISKWINKKYIEDNGNIEKYKVLVPKSNGSGAIGEVLSTPLIGEPLIGEPLIGFTQSFISFGSFDNKSQAESVMKYIKTKFARTMLGILKVTQDNSSSTWKYVPLQDFSEKSDIDWTKSIAEIDHQLYEKYGLDANEIEFIESKVKVMD